MFWDILASLDQVLGSPVGTTIKVIESTGESRNYRHRQETINIVNTVMQSNRKDKIIALYKRIDELKDDIEKQESKEIPGLNLIELYKEQIVKYRIEIMAL